MTEARAHWIFAAMNSNAALMLIVVGLLGCLSPLPAAEPEKPAPVMPTEVTLTSGRVLRGVSVVRWERDRVVLKHVGGADPIAFSLFLKPTPAELMLIRGGDTRVPARPEVKATARTVEGQVFFVVGGNSRTPRMGGVEVRLYSESAFREWEARRPSPIGYRLPIITGLYSPPNIREIEDYMGAQFASWDNMPEPLARTLTDLDGRFAIRTTTTEPTVLFARHRLRSSYGRGGGVNFCYVWVAEQNAEGATILGNDQIHPDMAKAFEFFK